MTPGAGAGAAGVTLGPAQGWPAAAGALASTRRGGVSAGPYAWLNLGLAVGDDPASVAENRRRFEAMLAGARPVWLRQVHGIDVVRLTAADPDRPAGEPIEADAAWTDVPGIACTVQVADCLPVLFAAPDGRAVAAVHAGWRGLAGGVLEAALAALCEGAACAPSDVHAWLGPCIGPAHFEVGADVLRAFGVDPEGAGHASRDAARLFRARMRADGSPGWLADLPALAAARLRTRGLMAVSGGHWCTVADPSRFFSYRRDGVTGRLAAAVWRRGR
jgi:YfiH family protein